MPTHLHLVSRKAIQIASIRSQLTRGQLQLVEGRPEHHVCRASLIHQYTVYLLLEYMALNEREGELFKEDFRRLFTLE